MRTANDGPAAIRTAAEFKPHVALLDIGLPVMDGYELAERLQQLPELTGIRLFAVTRYAQEADRERCRAAGFDGHFAKPLDVGVLERVLREAAGSVDPMSHSSTDNGGTPVLLHRAREDVVRRVDETSAASRRRKEGAPYELRIAFRCLERTGAVARADARRSRRT